jgi:hypothetical protein
MPTLPTFFSGWEGPAIALAVFGVSFARQSTGIGLAGATLSAPFCVFASGYPLLGGLAWTALIGNIVAACLMHRRRDVAFAALTPFAALCIFLTVLALRGITLAHT